MKALVPLLRTRFGAFVQAARTGRQAIERERTLRKSAEASQTSTNEELLEELGAMTRLHEFSTRMLAKTQLQPLLEEALDATIGLQSADFGTVQLFDAERGVLQILAQRGFSSEVVAHFQECRDDTTACGRALSSGERVVIEDVLHDEKFAQHRSAALAAGYRAAQSTPLQSRNGDKLGVISTYFRSAHRPLERELHFSDLYAHLAAELIHRQQTEEALRASEERFRKYFDLGLIGIAITSPVKGIVEVNEELCRILGYEREELLRMTWAQCTHPDDLAEDVLSFERIMAGEIDGYTLDKRWIRKDGQIINSIMAAQCVRRADGSVAHFVGLVQDITRRTRAEEALHKARSELAHVARAAAMGELAASIAHEIKQPLAAVITNAGACAHWLSMTPPDMLEAKAAALRIAQDANRASEVVTHIRNFLQRGSEQRETLHIDEVVEEVAAIVADEIRARDVWMRVDCATALPPVTADRVQLQQVILNLIMNALEAMSGVLDRSRILDIEVRRSGPYALSVAVRDSGTGLLTDRERIFEAFHTTKPHGMGIGLAMSRSIVEAHGGSMWATPNEGHGETFQFTLPVASASGAEPGAGLESALDERSGVTAHARQNAAMNATQS